MHTVTVRVPASTSNCGPGFDTLGLALDLWNEVTVRTCGGGTAGARNVDVDSGDPHSGVEMAVEAARRFSEAAGREPEAVEFRVRGDVPPARGLGSSVTLIAGIAAALNEAAGRPLGREAIAALVTAQEGHPDNATASVLGGFCVARMGETGGVLAAVRRIPVPAEVRFVVAVPTQEVLTKESRAVLPESLAHGGAVRAVNSVSWLVAAIAAGDWPALRLAMEDCLHQPYRLPRIPGATDAIRAGVEAGAWGGWLSGSGSSVLCVASRSAAGAAGAAMREAFRGRGVECRILDLQAANGGLEVARATAG